MKKISLLVMPLMAIPFLASCGNKTITITWKNYDGTVLEEDKNVERDSIPTYDGDEPYMPCDGEALYYFEGWDPEVTKATKSQTYTAKYNIVDVKNIDAYFEVVIPDHAVPTDEMYILLTAMPDKEALIDWGDDTNSDIETHKYEKPGKYEIKISNITKLSFLGGSKYITKAYFSKNIEHIDGEVIYLCDSLTSITVDKRSEFYDSRDNCNGVIDKSNNALVYGCAYTIIPHSVKSIGDVAFQYCDTLKSITIPNSVSSIGYCAFAYCSSLESIVFEDGSTLETIGERAFEWCESLKSIIIPKSVTSIDKYAFNHCSSLESIVFEDGSTLKIIGEHTFNDCKSLESIAIPNTVTAISHCAFENCSLLKTCDLTAFKYIEGLQVPYCDGNAFDGCHDDLMFEASSEDAANVFKTRGGGWPNSIDKYNWPGKN